MLAVRGPADFDLLRGAAVVLSLSKYLMSSATLPPLGGAGLDPDR